MSSVEDHVSTKCPDICMGSPHMVEFKYHKIQSVVEVDQSRPMEICN